MSTLVLTRLELRNFKGFRANVFEFDHPETIYRGDNATGKTTLQDACNFLLFGKDSLGRTDFAIKPLDSNGSPTTNLEHSVEGTFLLLDDRELVLRRTLTEKWVKKRGQAEQEFAGHETKFHVDGVPCSLKEYQAKIGSIASEDIFRLLTDPRHFNDERAFPWQKRRAALLDLCGDISDSDVLDSDPQLEPLKAILGARTFEDHKKVVVERRKKINEDLKAIPVRIDEATRSIEAAPKVTAEDAGLLAHWQEQRAIKLAELSRLENDQESAEKTKCLRELEGELLASDNAQIAKRTEAEQSKRDKLRPLRDELAKVESSIARLPAEIQSIGAKVAAYEAELVALRKAWTAIDAEQPAVTTSTFCPTCNQTLPIEQIEAAEQKAIAAFNDRKSLRLSEIRSKGKTLAAELERIRSVKADLESTLAGQSEMKAQLDQTISTIEAEPIVIPPDPKREEIAAGIDILKAAISELALGTHDPIAAVKADLEDIDKAIAEIEKRRAAASATEQTKERIRTLKAKEKELAKEFERLEHELYLIEQFTRAKVSMLTDRINGRFEIARWKLFEDQINGGLSECCTVMLDGVPYGSTNNAGRIQVGMDIIKTFQREHNLYLPCWIDNRESIVALPEMSCQVISLVVSEQHKELTRGEP